MPPSVRGAHGQSKTWPAARSSCSAEHLLEDLRPRRGHAKLGDALLKKRRAECDVLGPADRPIARGEILDGFADREHAAAEDEPAVDLKLRERETRLHRDRMAVPVGVDVVSHNGGFAVRRHACRRLFFRRSAEDVDTEVVTQEACKQRRF